MMYSGNKKTNNETDEKRLLARKFLAGDTPQKTIEHTAKESTPKEKPAVSAPVAIPTPTPASDVPIKKETYIPREKLVSASLALEGEERARAREEAIRRANEEALRAEKKKEEEARRVREAEEVKQREAKRVADDIARTQKEEEERRAREAQVKESEATARAQYTEEMIAKMKKRRKELNKQEGVVEEPIPVLVPKTSSSAPLRTFVVDAATAIQERGDSLMKLRLAEQKKKAEDSAREERLRAERSAVRKKKIIIFMFLFLLLGTISGFALYANPNIIAELFPKEGSNISKPLILADALVVPDEEKNIRVEGEATAIIAMVGTEISLPISFGTIKHIYFTQQKATETPEGVVRTQERVTAQEFLDMWHPAMDDSLRRALGERFMLGTRASASTTTTPFLIFSVVSFERAFAGMLKWEQFMLEDTDALWFGAEGSEDGTPVSGFRDSTIDGKDARVLVDTAGNTILLYSFITPDTLVITKNKGTLSEVGNKVRR